LPVLLSKSGYYDTYPEGVYQDSGLYSPTTESIWDGSAWQDADTEPGPYLVSQDPVTFKFEITNTGNVDLVNIGLTDTDIGTFYRDSTLNTQITFPTTLATGESLTAYGSLDWAAGQHENTAEVTGSTQDDELVEDSDACHYFGANPAIVIEKTTNNVDADDPNGPTIEEGQTVTWRYVVTNIGNVPLTNINVTDDQGVTPVYFSGDTNGDGILDPNETWLYSATGVAAVGPYSNIGSVSGYWAQIETVVDDTDLSHYLGTAIQNPPEDPPGPPPGPPYFPPGPPYFPPGPPVNPPGPPVSDLDIPPEPPGTQPEAQTLELEPEEPGTQPDEEQVLVLDPEAPGTTPDSGGTILPMLALSLMLIGSGAAIKKFKVK